MLPKDLLYIASNQYCGYATKLLRQQQKTAMVSGIDPTVLDAELDLIKEDRTMFRKDHVELENLDCPANLFYNGRLYFLDPGIYTFTFSDVTAHNLRIINTALYQHLWRLQKQIDDQRQEVAEILQKLSIEPTTSVLDQATDLMTKIFDFDYYPFLCSNPFKDYLTYLRTILKKYGSLINYKQDLFTKVWKHNLCLSRWCGEINELKSKISK